MDDCKGDVAVLRVFLDESGTHGGWPVVTVGAAWAKPTVWQKWTKDWIIKKRPIAIHHSTDCHNRENEYEGWSRDQRDEYVKRLLPVIPKHRINGRVGGLHIQSYETRIAFRPEVRAAFGDPYIAALKWATWDICETAKAQGHRRVAFIHEDNDFSERVFRAFDKAKISFPDMQITFAFGAKRDYVPLQCADVLAFEGNRRLRNRKVWRKPLDVIDPDNNRIGYIDWDEDNMDEFISRMCHLYDHLTSLGHVPEQSL